MATSVLELAETIWRRIRGAEPFAVVCDPAYPHDVQYRSPDVSKAKAVLGFEATTSLAQMLDEVIPWIERAVHEGQI